MRDDEILNRAKVLCDIGMLRLNAGEITTSRLRRIVAVEDELEARYMVPALLEIIERRGLKDQNSEDVEDFALRSESCPGADCLMCSGAACNLCGAGCWNNVASHCEHAVDERHMSPQAPR